MMFASGHLPNVGPTDPGKPVNMSEQYGRILNELEHAHIYIADLNETNRQLRADHARQQEKLARQENRISRLEAVLAEIAAQPKN